MTELEKLHTFLALCARAGEHPALYPQLRQSAQTISNWDFLLKLAKVHRITPLLYTHLLGAQISLPAPIQNDLRANFIIHSRANHIRGRILAEILESFANADIQILVLKGMAVAHLLYPRPGLRPMNDIDLLVSQLNAPKAQKLLSKLGFSSQAPQESDFEHHHLPPASHQVDGVPIHIEIHHNLSRKQSPATQFEALYPKSIPFSLSGTPARALGYADMLTHTYSHLVEAPFQPFRLIWIADMINLMEKFADQLDWERVTARVSNLLPLFSEMPPFNLSLPEKAPHLHGYPFNVLPAQNKAEYTRNIPKAFNPTEWWLRLNYGVPPKQRLFGMKIWHIVHLLWWGIRFRGVPEIWRRFKNQNT